MTELNCSTKREKSPNLSIEPLKKPISSQQPFLPKQKPTLSLEAKSLSQQKVKRMKATIWSAIEVITGQKSVSKIIGQAVGLDKNIQKLSIFLPESFTDQDALYLTHGLKRLKSLKKLTLYLRSTDTGLYYLFKGLKRLCWIKRFSLDFDSADLITDAGLDSLRKSLKKMLFLEDFYLHLWPLPRRTQISDEGLSRFNGSFNRLARLKSLTLWILDFEEMTDMSLANLRLQKLVFLQKVDLFFNGCWQLTDRSLYFLAQGLKALPKFQTLKLSVWDCKEFTDLGLHCLWKLIKSLPSFQEISLIFAECLGITNEGFVDMNETLKNSACSLRNIHFEFYSCPRISNSGFASFCKVLERSVSLQSLFIEFENITDYGLLCLCQALGRLVLLQKLHFNFGGCSKMTDVAAIRVISCMENLSDLKDVGIDFGYNMKITDKSINSIIQFLKSQTSLERVFLSVESMTGATDEAKDNLKKEIENLKKQRPNLEMKFERE